jgi:hypothetical protein
MSTVEVQKPLKYFRVAWQSALAAGLCLGLPAGLLLWLILFQEINHSTVTEQSVTLLQANGVNKIIVLAVCSLMWSFLLGRISGYRPWWKIGFATVLGIFAGWFSPLSNLDGWFGDEVPVYTLYAISMCGLVWIVTVCVGLAYGLILRNRRAALRMAFTTSFISVLTVVLTIILFEQFGIRVGTGNFAMSKVTVTSLLTSVITGGMVLGVGFSRFVGEEKYRPPA